MNPKEPRNGKKGGRILAGKGDKTVYKYAANGEKECVTILVTANAAGKKAPPMIVYKYERVPVEISRTVPEEWGIGRSPKSGWMTAGTFYEYICNVFEPWLTAENIKRPVILFVDGSRFTYDITFE